MQVHVTVNGLGERAGNAALEETVLALMAFYNIETSVDTRKIGPTSRLVSRLTGVPVLFGMLVVPAQAGKHPVALEKGVTSQKCLECHESKTKGKAVHSAMAKGCLSCHEVRVTADVTRTKLTTATPLKLCLQCHSGKDASQIKGKSGT